MIPVSMGAHRRVMSGVGAALAVALLFASSGVAEAGTWRIGERLNYFCRNGEKSRDSVQYCHNCNNVFGPGSYVTWTFPVTCDGRRTSFQVRGELKCNGWPSEPEQRRRITDNAVSKLPTSSRACPR
ncbi:type 2 periplasmic-binding domain-containing protein [Roseixanthobacter pseudopolyaromaticivorans]|uniref:hypothetical protein n=1 Tax=Xanthobacteraceae TaxID=335928 RepID=UPI00372B5FEC